MIVCEFCLHYGQGGQCKLGLNIPKGLTCREFAPGIEKFCADPKDFVNENQIVQMATFFGFQRTELKKIKIMAASEEKISLTAVLGDAQGAEGY
jgi:hypothetical protein